MSHWQNAFVCSKCNKLVHMVSTKKRLSHVSPKLTAELLVAQSAHGCGLVPLDYLVKIVNGNIPSVQ